jgi:hypothetical protein
MVSVENGKKIRNARYKILEAEKYEISIVFLYIRNSVLKNYTL